MRRTQRTYRGYVHRDDSTEDGDGKPLRIVAATAGRKADGLNLQMEGADLGRFQANPIMGYGHMYFGRDSLPIGRSDETWIDDDRLLMDVSFDQDDEFARTVERKYRKGYLNTFSIGFDAEVDENSGLVKNWELFEVSAVPLPMDPDAAVESGRDQELMLARALEDVRAGAVLSKKNKKLVSDAAAALQALLEAADKNKDDEDEDDEGRSTSADQARLLRLAGIRPT